MMNKVVSKKPNKEEQIKQKFSKTLDMYPIKNLEDLYDKEGYRDEEFDKDDKGVWKLQSVFTTNGPNDSLINKGAVLDIDRNKKISEGCYFVETISEDDKGGIQNNEKKYPVKIKGDHLVPVKSNLNKHVEKEIRDFQFFMQYANFKGLKKYDDGDITYNPEVPSYEAEFKLNNKDYNVKQLRSRYHISSKKDPTLNIQTVGNLKGSSVGYKKMEYVFERNQKGEISFTDFLNYEPSKE